MIHSDDRCDHVTRRQMILSSLALGFSVSPEQSRQWNASQIERIRRSVDQSRRPYLASENGVFFGKEDDLSKLVGFLETSFEGCTRRYGQSFPTIWFLSNQRTLGNSGLFNRVIDMAESANANRRMPQGQRDAIKSHLGAFLSSVSGRSADELIEVSVLDFGYGTKHVAAPVAKGKDIFVPREKTTSVHGQPLKIGTTHRKGTPRFNFDPKAWIVARDSQEAGSRVNRSNGGDTRFSVSPAQRKTQWFGRLVTSYEERLRLIDLDEAKEVEAHYFKRGHVGHSARNVSGSRVSLGSMEVRIRCVRYEPVPAENTFRVHRLEIILVPEDFALHQIISRSSPIDCYVETLPGVRSMLATSLAS